MKDIKIELNASETSGEAYWRKRCDVVEAEISRLRAELEREKVDALNYADQMERLRSVNAELVEALQLMKCPLCNDNLLPTRLNNGLYAHEYQTACAFVCEELSEIQIEVLRDAALGRALRRMPKDRGISHSSGLDVPEGWHVWGITRVIGSGVSPKAALQAAGLWEVEK